MCTKSIKLHRLLFVGFRTVYSQVIDALHLLLYQIHQTPPAAFVGFRTVYSQAMDALHLLLYQLHQSLTIGVPFYCVLMDFGGFGMVPSQKCLGVEDIHLCENIVLRNLKQLSFGAHVQVNALFKLATILPMGCVRIKALLCFSVCI